MGSLKNQASSPAPLKSGIAIVGFEFDQWHCPAASGTWTTTGSLAAQTVGHTATLLPNGKVLVAAGTDTGYRSFKTAEFYERPRRP